MAEAVGLAASIAGLIGLASQVLQGSIFVQQLFEDVRNAPAEVLDLRDELDLFVFVARDTQKLFQRASETLPSIDTSNFERILERSDRIVNEIGDKLARYSGNTGQVKRLWWTRLKVASRKKVLGDYMRRLERAKGQLLVVQSNLTQSFLLGQQTNLQETNESLIVTKTTVNHIHSQGILLAGRIERLDKDFNDGLVDIREDLKLFRLNAKAIATHPSHQNPLENWGDDDSSPMGRNIRTTGVVEQSFYSEHSKLEVHRILNNPRTNHAEELWRRNASTKIWRTTSTQHLNFWVVRINVETEEGVSEPLCYDNEDSAAEAPSIAQKSIYAYFRIPFFQRKIVIQYRSSSYPYCNGFGMQFRTYNTLPQDSPIAKACHNLDLPLVQELLKTKSASPFDRCTSILGDFSLINAILCGLVWSSKYSSRAKIARGWDLFQYLLPILHDDSQMLNPNAFNWALVDLMSNCDRDIPPVVVDAVRRILLQSPANPFLRSTGLFITLDRLASPLSKFLVEQTYHSIDICDFRPDICGDEFSEYFLENDRIMLADPEGRNMKAAYKEGYKFHLITGRGDGRLDENVDAKFKLLELAHATDNPVLVACCRNRLSFLIQNEYGIEDVDSILSPKIVLVTDHGFVGVIRASLLQYALQLEIWDFFGDALSQSGWPPEAINDLLDQELYAGIPELLDGQIEYQTRASQQKRFVLDLTEGRFLNTPEEDLPNLSFEYILYTGASYWSLRKAIEEVNLAFRQKLTPGSWNSDEGIQLVLGIDISPFIWDHN